MSDPAAVDTTALQRRTVRTLIVAQAAGALGITIGIATASLLAKELSGSEEMAGLAQTFQVLGSAVASFLLAQLMAKRGRRIGLVTGNLIGALGSGIAVLAGVVESMPLLLLGAALLGTTTAANLGARYAATDLATDEHRARDLSIVVWATTLGAVLGPNLTGVSADFADLLGIPELTGPFALGTIGMFVAALVLWIFLRPDPLLTAKANAGVVPAVTGTSWGRARQIVRDKPVVLAAVMAMAAAHAVMISVMVMTPLHMEHGGAELEIIGFVISLHVLGMFAFAPLVGWGADRAGRAPVIAIGGVTLLSALLLCGLSPEGTSWQIFAGLFLLGIGWSFVTVSASALLTEHTPLSARTDVQGSADLIMGVTAAAAGGLAGLVVGMLGYSWLNLFSAGLAAVVVVAAVRAGAPKDPEREPVASA